MRNTPVVNAEQGWNLLATRVQSRTPNQTREPSKKTYLSATPDLCLVAAHFTRQHILHMLSSKIDAQKCPLGASQQLSPSEEAQRPTTPQVRASKSGKQQWTGDQCKTMRAPEEIAEAADEAQCSSPDEGCNEACHNQVLVAGCPEHRPPMQHALSALNNGSVACIASELMSMQHELETLHSQYSHLHQMCDSLQEVSNSPLQLDTLARPRL